MILRICVCIEVMDIPTGMRATFQIPEAQKRIKNRPAEEFEIMAQLRRKKCAHSKSFKFQNPEKTDYLWVGITNRLYLCLFVVVSNKVTSERTLTFCTTVTRQERFDNNNRVTTTIQSGVEK